MAFSSADAAKLQQQLQEIERLSRLLGANINTINLQPVEANAGAIEAIFQRLTNQAAGLGEETDYLVSNFQKLVGEIKKSGTGINESTKGLRALSSITEQISSYQKGYNDLSSKEIAKLKNKAKIETDRLKNARQIIEDETYELYLQSRSSSFTSLSVKQQQAILDKLAKNQIARENINNLLENEDVTLGELNNKLKEAEDNAKRIEKALGITGKALKGISKIPILGDLVNTEEALKAASDAAKNGAGQIGTMGAAMGSLGKSLLSSLSDPLVVIGLLIKGFQKLVELGFAADKQIVDLSKSMSSSREQAAALRQRFTEIQDGSIKVGGSLNDNLKTTKNLVAAQLELADAFGTGLGFTDRQLADQILLTKQIGLSVDEAANLQQLAMANGKTADDIIDTTIAQTSALAKQTGIQLNNKKVLSEVAKVSGQLRLQYQNNPELIAKAVIQTQKLGISLEQAAKSASHLLNFEESIENQISAELLTGKQLNLERARLLALNGDVAGSMQEMLGQIGSAAEFSQMNVIQQEALAKAVGMTADELANSLVQQENLNRLGSDTKKQIQERVQALRDAGEEEKANQLMRSLGNEKDAKDALTKIDAQTNFNNLVERLTGILGDAAAGPMAEILDQLSDWASKTENIQALITGVKTAAQGIASIVGFLINNFKTLAVIMAAMAVAWAVMNPVAAIAGLATAAIVGGVVALSDGEVSSDGLVVGKYNKGQIQPIAQGRADDNVIFTTNKISNNTTNTDNSELAREMKEIKAILTDTLNIDKQMVALNMAKQAASIVMDSTRLGTAVNMGTYSVQ